MQHERPINDAAIPHHWHPLIGLGIDKAVGAFLGLFQGQNVGKMVVELA